MKRKEIKQNIDSELNGMVFTDSMKEKVFEKPKQRIAYSILRYAVMIVLTFLLGGTTVFAGYYFLNKVNVNETTLPKLDEMQVVEIAPLQTETDAYGRVRTEFFDYAALQDALGIDLLDSKYAAEQSYLQGKIETDGKDYAIIKMENYIIGDTRNYTYWEEEDRYQYEHGEAYSSPVSLSIDLILSQEQLAQGWETDYLGFYEYAESYTSKQGYKVNLIQDTTGDEKTGDETIGDNTAADYISEKCAVFVANGIRYTVRGRTSMETIKEIVDSME